ncbi:MAG TPA: hypothetical protein VFV08_09295, partial [Puia sp.]|nr:hypothetical protein [Puia sp.]
MEMLEIADPIFQNAVDAIDHGNISHLADLLETNPDLVSRRLDTGEGYFKNPYLLWFVADNPIRQKKLAANIVDITRLLLKFVHRYAKDSAQDQIDYAFGLVESGSVARECNVQIDLIDLLIENGASASNAHDALANGNIEAARHILERTGKISLAAAVSLERMDDVKQLLNTATMEEKQIALMAASFFGKAEM